MSLVAMPLAISAARTAAADLLADESAAAFVEARAETVALKRTASGTTDTVPTPVTVMYRLSAVPAPLAGIASAITPATAEIMNRDAIVRSFVSFMGQVSRICCDGHKLLLGIVGELLGEPVLKHVRCIGTG